VKCKELIHQNKINVSCASKGHVKAQQSKISLLQTPINIWNYLAVTKKENKEKKEKL
jgi:hypothetical protein